MQDAIGLPCAALSSYHECLLWLVLTALRQSAPAKDEACQQKASIGLGLNSLGVPWDLAVQRGTQYVKDSAALHFVKQIVAAKSVTQQTTSLAVLDVPALQKLLRFVEKIGYLRQLSLNV